MKTEKNNSYNEGSMVRRERVSRCASPVQFSVFYCSFLDHHRSETVRGGVFCPMRLCCCFITTDGRGSEELIYAWLEFG